MEIVISPSIKEAYDKLKYPGYYAGRTMKKSLAMALCSAQIKIAGEVMRACNELGKGRTANPPCGMYQTSFEILKHWLKALNYLKGNRNWEECGGINNPFLCGQIAILND